METMVIAQIPNWINGRDALPTENGWLDKYDPHSGELLSRVADSTAVDVQHAIEAAARAYPEWSELTPVKRGQVLGHLVEGMKRRSDELAACMAKETGKPPQDAKGEVSGAILQGEYFSGEGMRLYGRSLSSGMVGKYSHTVRQSRGIAGLIVPANTPIANIAWKVFPALICGNTVVLKAAEDAPHIAWLFGQLSKEVGLPDGVLNVIQGSGQKAGAPLVMDSRVAVISFTGSTGVGRWIAEVAGKRLARVSLELGGKNPFVVCDDADMEQAVRWASLSAFSNAGQRCAAGSRLLVFRQVYEEFRDRLIAKANSLKLGVDANCDLGPVINQRQYQSILDVIRQAKTEGGKILCGGTAPSDPQLAQGYYILPTVIDGLSLGSDLNCQEVFGPVATLYSVDNFTEALQLANASEYGLTAAIHTRSVDRAMWFAQRARVGMVNINLGTYGSEPHMPFGGFGASGNGTREPGIEALDVYSELKNISFLVRPDQL